MVCLLAGAVSNATAVSVVPASLNPGEPVAISVSDLPDGSKCSIRLAGSFSVAPGGDYVFGVSEFVMPFSLNNGAVTAKAANTQYNVLSVQKDDTEVRASGISTNDQFTVTKPMAILQGTYDSVLLAGTAAANATRVDAELDITGTKQGPKDSTIRFFIDGIEEGSVVVTVLVDDVPVFSGTVPVGTPSSPGNTAVLTTPVVFDQENSAPNLLEAGNTTQGNNVSPEAGLAGGAAQASPSPAPTKAGLSVAVSLVCAGAAGLIFTRRG